MRRRAGPIAESTTGAPRHDLEVTYAPMRTLSIARRGIRTTLDGVLTNAASRRNASRTGDTAPGAEGLALSDAMARSEPNGFFVVAEIAAEVAMDYGALWTAGRQRDPATAPRLNDSSRPIDRSLSSATLRDRGGRGPTFSRLRRCDSCTSRDRDRVPHRRSRAVGLVAAASRRRLPPAIAAASLAALTAHGIVFSRRSRRQASRGSWSACCRRP